MSKIRKIIFFVVFYILNALINTYIFVRGFEGLELHPSLRLYYGIIFLIVSNCFIAGRILEKRYISLVSDIFIWIGSFWFAFILYFFLSAVLIDIVRLADLVGHFLPTGVANMQLKFFVMMGDVCLIGLLCIIGYLNARKIRVKKLSFTIPKSNPSAKELTIAVASDIHLGTINGRSFTKKVVDTLNSLKPDIILLPGDIVDGDVEPVIKLNLGEVLRMLHSRYGVYAVTGNHEYIGGVEPSVKYISDHGIRVLRDEHLEVAGMTIIGREDRSLGKTRKTIKELAEGIDNSKPIILLDHQPFKLDEAVSIGADIQLSGHTHNGQLWPLNFITKKVYELSWGYKKKEQTHVYVSCGVGTWGPPMKIGNVSEILEIRLKFQ
jgi:predicted MPP superfamily phosphohydrolase